MLLCRVCALSGRALHHFDYQAEEGGADWAAHNLQDRRHHHVVHSQWCCALRSSWWEQVKTDLSLSASTGMFHYSGLHSFEVQRAIGIVNCAGIWRLGICWYERDFCFALLSCDTDSDRVTCVKLRTPTHTRTHTYIHTHTHTHSCTHSCTCIHTCTLMHTLMHMHTHMHTHACMHIHTHTHTRMHTYTFTIIHTHTFTVTHTHTCTLMHSDMHTYMHIYMQHTCTHTHTHTLTTKHTHTCMYAHVSSSQALERSHKFHVQDLEKKHWLL